MECENSTNQEEILKKIEKDKIMIANREMEKVQQEEMVKNSCKWSFCELW